MTIASTTTLCNVTIPIFPNQIVKMWGGQTITLSFLRVDGKEESVHLTNRTLADARAAAEYILESAGGLYKKADLCIGGYLIETIELRRLL